MGTLVSIHADILDHWTTNQITTNSFLFDSIACGNGLYVLAAEYYDDSEIYTSTNGINWTITMHDAGPWGLNLHYLNGRFMGNGGYGSTVSSTNGVDWTVVNTPIGFAFNTFGDITYGIAFGHALYVKVGVTNDTSNTGQPSTVGSIIVSSDSTNWTNCTITPSAGGYISSIAYFPLGFVAIGNNDGYEYTWNGNPATSWTRRSIPGGNQIVYGNGRLIVPLNNTANLISFSGTSWGQQNTGLTNMVTDIICTSNMYYGIAGGHLATSSDGTNWYQYPQPLPGLNSQYMPFATDGAHIITLGNSGYIGYGPSAGSVYLSDSLADVRMTNSPASQVALYGLVGRNYQIQSTDILTAGSNNWRTNLSVQLTNTPYVWADGTATNSSRFYRGVLLP